MSNQLVNPNAEHPFIEDIDEKSVEQLLDQLNKIDRNINFAMRNGNRSLVNQLLMAKNSYQTVYSRKMAEQLEKMKVTSGVNITKSY